MKLSEFQAQMEEVGKLWMKGYQVKEYTLGERKIVFNKNQLDIINSKKRYVLAAGAYGSGKTLALLIKMILFCLFFPGNTVLLGREHLQDIDLTLLPDLWDLMQPRWYRYRVKDGIIQFFNKSRIVLFGLANLQEGSLADIKMAQQKLKSLNLGAYFIDQLEEIDKPVFETLNSRLRKKTVPIRQGNMTCNPANFWAYDFFVINPDKRDDIQLIQSSMMENTENLPEDYIKDQLNHDEKYVKRYVYGIWTPDVLTERSVFAEEYVLKFKSRNPLKVEEGCKIYEEPRQGLKYQMGVDPSEGSVDPSSISVVSEEGVKVAKFNGKIPIAALGEKVKFLYEKYHEPLIIPEVNAAGQALLLQIRDLNIYRRKVYDYKFDKETEKLGWKTNYQSKQALISHFQELLRQDFVRIYDKNTISELKTFVWSDTARQKGAGAQRGFHDDDVISTMLAYWEFSPKRILIKKRKAERERLKALQNKYKFQYQ